MRNASEYDLGHLYSAFLLPSYFIENWTWNSSGSNSSIQPEINFLLEHANDTIIVYCKAGSRSAPVCQILADHGISNVYNMEGGITAWMQAEYPIYTKYHHVSVDIVEDERIIDIQPMLLYSDNNCSTCQNCSVNSLITPTNASITIIEQVGGHTVYNVTGIVNGTLIQYNVTKNLLWQNSVTLDGVNRTTTLESTETVLNGKLNIVLGLIHLVKSNDFNLSVQTGLVPLDDRSYNESITMISYDPAGGAPIKTREFIELNFSDRLSQQYKVLGKTAETLANVCEDSNDRALKSNADYYSVIADEIKDLAELVKHELSVYDLTILSCQATAGVGLAPSDPEAVYNRGFEDGSSYWTLTGYGDHTITNEDSSYESYSALIGWEYSNPVANTRDSVYQLVGIPNYAENIQFSFDYHLFTEDSAEFDWFEVYLTPQGGSPHLVFQTGGQTDGDMEEYGWDTVSIDASEFAGQYVYIYFAVANMYDSALRTWCFVDDVSLTYNLCTFGCWGNYMSTCLDPELGLDALQCLWGCMMFSLLCFVAGPEGFGLCIATCGSLCGVGALIDLTWCGTQGAWACRCFGN